LGGGKGGRDRWREGGLALMPRSLTEFGIGRGRSGDVS